MEHTYVGSQGKKFVFPRSDLPEHLLVPRNAYLRYTPPRTMGRSDLGHEKYIDLGYLNLL